MNIKQQRGNRAEQLACEHLQHQGLTLVERNYRCRMGEIDLIMQDKETTVFVEVRLRNNPDFGSGADSIDFRKQRKLTRTALHYLQQHGLLDKRPSRFDVVSVDGGENYNIDWIRNALQGF